MNSPLLTRKNYWIPKLSSQPDIYLALAVSYPLYQHPQGIPHFPAYLELVTDRVTYLILKSFREQADLAPAKSLIRNYISLPTIVRLNPRNLGKHLVSHSHFQTIARAIVGNFRFPLKPQFSPPKPENIYEILLNYFTLEKWLEHTFNCSYKLPQ